jgi:K+-sensing histidine kinase KdpD
MRTPITTIFGNAQVLQRLGPHVDEESRRVALSDIEHDAERLQRIIENMWPSPASASASRSIRSPSS